jgi:hypothetical protein
MAKTIFLTARDTEGLKYWHVKKSAIICVEERSLATGLDVYRTVTLQDGTRLSVEEATDWIVDQIESDI